MKASEVYDLRSYLSLFRNDHEERAEYVLTLQSPLKTNVPAPLLLSMTSASYPYLITLNVFPGFAKGQDIKRWSPTIATSLKIFNDKLHEIHSISEAVRSLLATISVVAPL